VVTSTSVRWIGQWTGPALDVEMTWCMPLHQLQQFANLGGDVHHLVCSGDPSSETSWVYACDVLAVM